MRYLRIPVVPAALYLCLALLLLGQHGCGTSGPGREPDQPGRPRPDAVEPPPKAEVVRVFEYVTDTTAPPQDRQTTITIRDAQGNELDCCTKKASTMTRFEYNGMFVTKAISDAYVDVGNGKELLTKAETVFDPREQPQEQHLYAPDGRTLIGTYSLNVTPTARGVSWSPDVFFCHLPSKVYAYSGGRLTEVEDLPQTERGRRLGRDRNVNVIFASDFGAVKAVLPVARLSSPVAHAGLEITTVGFTLVTTDGRDALLPYARGHPPAETAEGGYKTIVYSRVPTELEAAFGELAEQGPASGQTS